MNLQARPYRGADLTQMKQLLMAGAQATPAISYMHPGYLDWDTHYPPDEEANQHNLFLWERTDVKLPTLAALARRAILRSLGRRYEYPKTGAKR